MHVLVGARQVGKTTIARQVAVRLGGPVVFASADGPMPPGPEWIDTQWRVAEIRASAERAPVLLVLDEVQKVRGWSDAVKRLWDAAPAPPADQRRVRLLALGSSALLLQAGLSESMSGRFFLHRCPHWTYLECRAAFGWSLEQWLYFGGYPGAAALADRAADWRQYVTDSLIETVLARDVLQLQRVAKPALLRHLFLMAAGYPAQILSYNKMLGQLLDAGNTTTLAHYLTLLEGAFLASGLPAFARGQVRRRASSPKLVLWNNALVSALGPLSFELAVASPDWWGRLVENAVGAHLLNHLPQARFAVHYWRVNDDEVDYVVEQGAEVWGVEVKSGRSRRAPGLPAFRRRYPDSRVLIVGGEGMPLEMFFATPPEALFTA
ncbi:MAG: ATP-binding protein [Gammaproteobacteria bacterium]|nr:ATP-binding protein [Gammaproteobacteria bacterium]